MLNFNGVVSCMPAALLLLYVRCKVEVTFIWKYTRDVWDYIVHYFTVLPPKKLSSTGLVKFYLFLPVCLIANQCCFMT